MQQWDRDTSGRLNRISTQPYLASEVSAQTDTMDPIPEEQQSQPGTPRNPNANRTMRDHIHPPRVSAPSCIVPPADDVAVRPYLVPLLPTYHGMENENPYTHLRDFEEVCTTFKEGMMDMDLLKLKAFPLTLKDKAKIWINSLRPRTIRDWAELQAEFLKKLFSAHKTNNLKRQIYTFAAQEGENFYQCWERFLETISACPHHGFDTWMLVNHFYGGMSPAMRQLLETMCGGDFLSKHPEEAMEFLTYVAETSKGWDEPNPREIERFRPSVNQRGGMYALNDEMEMRARLSTLARKVEELEGKQLHEVQALTDNTAQPNTCTNFQSPAQPVEQCSMTPAVKDLMSECAHTVGQFKPQQPNAPYGNTYNPNWRNHPNLAWRPNPPVYVPPGAKPQFGSPSQSQQPPPLSPVEQAVLNLSKMICTIQEEQKVHLSNMQDEISKLSNQLLQSSEKEKGPFQGQQYQTMVNEIGLTEDTTTRTDEVKAVVILRSGRELQTAIPELVKSASVVAEPPQEEESVAKEESREDECMTETILGEQVQLQPQEDLEVESLETLEELQDAPVNFWPWTKEEQIRALITEESSGQETGEEPQEPILQLIPMKLNPIATVQATKFPLLVPPSADLVYIQPQPTANSNPAAPAPKCKSNPLPAAPPESVFILSMPAAQPKPQASTTKATPSMLVLQNIRRLVAFVHTFAITSKKMANAYIAWHSGWFGCGFGFGTPGPRHF